MLNLSSESPYDVIVCGGGHAGCEAALASARMGAKTLLLSGNIDTVAQMSCNPAIGGLAKGHIVREIDALGGEMAVNSDATGIQFRVLNASKGVAVQSPRAQCDKKAYQFRMKSVLEATPNLSFFQAVATAIITDGKVIRGVKTNLGADFYGKTVVLTTGTFMKGLMHVGSSKTEGGRMGDFSSLTLSDSLAENGIEIGRLKTGTPARISGKSIDFSKCAVQYGDNPPTLFGFYDTRDIPVSEDSPCPTHDENSKMFHVEQSLGWAGFVGFGREQLACYETSTNEKTAEIIHKNLHRSAMYGGEIKGVGPRYCPSIEDKIVRFSHKDGHRLFLEPEGRFTDEWYINGLSTSMPLDVQVDIIHSVAGLENVEIFRPAYAVEYDFAPPTQLYPTLESRIIEGLFCAGQINGTSGYEEAAGQGLVAGINAHQNITGGAPFTLARDESYIGVLIDDLVNKGVDEPYRMFTSRAEYRILLRQDNADSRLTERSYKLGLADEYRLGLLKNKQEGETILTEMLRTTSIKAKDINTYLNQMGYGDLQQTCKLIDIVARPNVTITGMAEVLPELKEKIEALGTRKEEIVESTEINIKYKGYIEREKLAADKLRRLDNIRLPKDFDYNSVQSLSTEARQKLIRIQPNTIGEASRIPGVSPNDISVLLVLMGR